MFGHGVILATAALEHQRAVGVVGVKVLSHGITF
jgi:hypothetical protein